MRATGGPELNALMQQLRNLEPELLRFVGGAPPRRKSWASERCYKQCQHEHVCADYSLVPIAKYDVTGRTHTTQTQRSARRGGGAPPPGALNAH